MDKFEEFGKRFDEELARLRRYLEQEVAPETEKRTAQFLREVSASGVIYQRARCRWRYRFGDQSTRRILHFPYAIVLKTPKRIENIDGT